jgi:UDP-N-acetylmuramoyl-L-alanyl-D-glutamate--2,6-diaminopimelate ligase
MTALPSKTLSELLANLPHRAVWGDRSVRIAHITDDSREVQPGALFVAIVGSQHDGHHYIGTAIAKGAVAIVGQRADLKLPARIPYVLVWDSRRALAQLACAFYDFPTEKLFTVGVTGTNGKTSVATLSAAVLGESALSTTVQNALEHDLPYTTPGAVEIQRRAWEAVHSGQKHFVLEVSAHALSQERVYGIDFDVAIFTNLTHDHLDYYRSMEEYLRAKLRLFEDLRPEARAIINGDDPYSQAFLQATKARVWTYGFSPHNDLWADGVELRPEGSRFVAHTPVGDLPIETSLPGEFYVSNILAAIGVGIERGLDLELIKERIESVRQIEGRCERYRTRNGVFVWIDFAHSPDSLEKMLRTVKRFYSRVICVFGCGGESDPYKRPIMGEISGRFADYTLITSDNPKSEDPEKIVRQIEAGIAPLGVPYEVIVDRGRAILRACELARPGDCVLIAGKGHERTQIFSDHEIEFNDREFLREHGVIV